MCYNVLMSMYESTPVDLVFPKKAKVENRDTSPLPPQTTLDVVLCLVGVVISIVLVYAIGISLVLYLESL